MGSSVPQDGARGGSDGQVQHEIDPYIEHVARCLEGRKGLLFSRELHAGTGALGAVAGDAIVALEGVKAPMILRAEARSSATFKLVGAALFAGIGVEELGVYCSGRPVKQWKTITLV
jgi:hypothetical protein